MRIYLDKFNFKMSKLNLLEQYKRDSFQVTYVYTSEGVFRVDRGHTMRRIDFIDGPIETIPDYINDVGIILDQGIIKKRTQNVSHIPIDHFSRDVVISNYSLQSDSPVNLVTEQNPDGEVTEVYFILNSKKYASYSTADIENPLIKEDVEKLFNLLKYR